MPQRLAQKRSITVAGHRTSITLEGPFWESLKEIAAARQKSVSMLIAEVDAAQPENLSGALRVFILDYYKKKAGVQKGAA
jgi:predicted DNA-binding ribbon-helix-helix protein